MSVEAKPIRPVGSHRLRAYRIALGISVVLNVLLIGVLYLYSTVESFMSVIESAVGLLG